jgi:hypothetical protein
MNLWINGDWITGEGEKRTKTNPVGQETLWQGNDASPVLDHLGPPAPTSTYCGATSWLKRR